MLYREIIAVCSQIHTKHINTLCGQNVEFVNVKPGGTSSDHWALKDLTQACRSRSSIREIKADVAKSVPSSPVSSTSCSITCTGVSVRAHS